MQTAQQLHTELVLYPAGTGAEPMEGVLTGTRDLPTAAVRIRIGSALQRTSPPQPYFLQFGLHSSAPAHNTKLEDNILEHKLYGTHGHIVHRPGLASPAARSLTMEHGGDGQPKESDHGARR
ncbi:hypothetical protein DUI87_16406 [Hirundo rustica rustica]|uniref:Uncharacterized protein n=1 Tax=Hirundo rustica rustica TaxID=333673 RepID=A0A3M0K6M7_HIRRU|nr:hypothetical protein DUI87_16406 [Hirundo rustica rustica]